MSLPVTLTGELGWLSSISGLQLTSGHDNWANPQFLVGQCALEGLTLTLSSPDTKNKRHLDLGQIQEVFSDVHSYLVQKRWRAAPLQKDSVIEAAHDYSLSKV